jgi:hypothetical protein
MTGFRVTSARRARVSVKGSGRSFNSGRRFAPGNGFGPAQNRFRHTADFSSDFFKKIVLLTHAPW